MTAIHHDLLGDDDLRRTALYRGDLLVTSPDDATRAFCAFAHELVLEAFDGLDPEVAQHALALERFAAILGEVKPRFIHHPASKTHIRSILEQRGCDLSLTYFDVPRLRTSTSDGYLTSGIAYAWHPHRDTWYSAPMAQLNFWMPVYDIEPGNGMAFHPIYFGVSLPNTSGTYNYYEWNAKHRGAATTNVKQETRPLPRSTVEVDVTDPLVLVTPVGGLLQFSGQHLHSSVPNQTGRTRYSIDFRTVHIGDLAAGLSAPNVDAECTGSSIRDFIRADDFSPMPDEIVALFDDGTEDRGALLYEGSR
jgi:hypothetical protein